MRKTMTIALKDLRAYFVSPIGYTVLSVFLLLTGWLFNGLINRYIMITMYYQQMGNPSAFRDFNLNTQILTPFFHNMVFVFIFIVPLFTMRLFAEERKMRTDELLMTLPLEDIHILMGKFFAGLSFLGIVLISTVVFPILLVIYGNPDVGPIFSGYLGVFLVGAAFVSVGLFASFTTENQVVAAIVSFVIFLLLYLININVPEAESSFKSILMYLSLFDQMDSFAKGLIALPNIVYLVSFCVLGLFLGKIAIEIRRWR
jgi:ABC-2 type transport system permease protein